MINNQFNLFNANLLSLPCFFLATVYCITVCIIIWDSRTYYIYFLWKYQNISSLSSTLLLKVSSYHNKHGVQFISVRARPISYKLSYNKIRLPTLSILLRLILCLLSLNAFTLQWCFLISSFITILSSFLLNALY